MTITTLSSREFNQDTSWPSQGISDAPAFAREALVFLDAEQDMGGLASVGDENWPFCGGFLRPAGVLVELPAG